ncbi:hypothetical protein GGI20_000907 [Coemansia sp. BCRC 34301]|nr:hypothetical protein GGI20_000907 [Coemansia sp. BCRC 34301]
MQTDARISRFKLEFPVRVGAGAGAGLSPRQTYYGRVVMQAEGLVEVKQVHVQLEGWEKVDVGGGAHGGPPRSLIHVTAGLLESERTVRGRVSYSFACTMPNVNFPAAMQSAICSIAYKATAWASGGGGRRLAGDTVDVQVAPHVVPSGVGWLKPLVLRDGVEVAGAKRRLRRTVAAPAMAICVRVRNHCCTLGEAIAVDVDTTMLQRDRVLAAVRAAIVEQVALKSRDGPPLVLAERTLNRKAVAGEAGVHDMRIRVPRRDVCTADGAALSFGHVLRLTFELAGVATKGVCVATKDVPLRLVTSKFGDVGRASQVEINRRLSALTAESDGGAVSEAYGYLLNESERAARPMSLDVLLATGEVPQPRIAATNTSSDLSQDSPLQDCCTELRSPSQESCVVPPTPAPPAFQFGPLPPLPPPATPTPTPSLPTNTDPDTDAAFCFAPRISQCAARIRDTLVDNALGRESSQSESETIVFSPRQHQCDSSSTRSATPEPSALPPTLPTIKSMDLLNCSTVFDSLEFSSYWTTNSTGLC